jgi:hypothetical protein
MDHFLGGGGGGVLLAGGGGGVLFTGTSYGSYTSYRGRYTLAGGLDSSIFCIIFGGGLFGSSFTYGSLCRCGGRLGLIPTGGGRVLGVSCSTSVLDSCL